MKEIERIRFLRQMVGPRINRRVGDKAWVGEGPGEIDPVEARQLALAGYVEVLRGRVVEERKAEPDTETATVEPVENAATRTRRPAGKPRKKR